MQRTFSGEPNGCDPRDWFFDHRFGLFIHWGIYAVGEWHEQHGFRLHMTRDEYVPFMDQFNPVNYDPDAWLDLAEEAGMSYVVFTTKHIDGFCMWDSDQTEYKVTNTPYGRDTLAMLAEACHRRNMPLCLYYSIADMHHPNYPTEGRSYELLEPAPGDEPDLERYLDYVRAQVEELCTRYGEIHGFWWDANQPVVDAPDINARIRELQPKAVIDPRGPGAGDTRTPERDWDDSVNQLQAFDVPTEACQSVGTESWGYRADEDYYADAYLMQSMAKVLAKGGNYLLNVGPQPDGAMPAEPTRILRAIGAWYHQVCEAWEQAEPAPGLVVNPEVLLTRRDNTLYVVCHKPPTRASVLLKPLNVLPQSATLLNDGSPVERRVELIPTEHRDAQAYLRLRNLPVNTRTDPLVIRLDFENLDS